jgi:hypothetical protein
MRDLLPRFTAGTRRVHTTAHAHITRLIEGERARRSAGSRCRKVLRELNLPASFTIDDLFAKAEIYRGGRKILRRATHFDGTTPNGMFVATTDVDLILYPVNTSMLHQLHIIAHELGHMLLGHGGRKTKVSAAEYSHAVLDPLDAIVQRKLGSKLAPALIQNMLRRSTYTDDKEREAEL